MVWGDISYDGSTEIRTPDAARNSLFNVTADDIRFRFASKAI
jgi:hypothetical protein